MLVKMNNKDEKFYQYMGKFFGSRLVEKQINDRIYDDDKKQWYFYLVDDNVEAFISIQNRKIKNIYCYKEKSLEELLKYVVKQEEIVNSIVTKRYIDTYIKCGFQIDENEYYKNFVTICYTILDELDR